MISIIDVKDIIKKVLVLAFIFMLTSSCFVYSVNVNNKNTIKTLNYKTLEEKQYDAYLESLYVPIETFLAEMTGYGGDCEGCSGILACRPITNVFTNGIYFEDDEYGTVRVVAADRKYPCGTIMKFYSKKLSDEPIVAIVMDRGGAIQDNRLDLLTESEAYSSKYVGRIYDLKVEVLRKGW